jgi:hypothetical protein
MAVVFFFLADHGVHCSMESPFDHDDEPVFILHILLGGSGVSYDLYLYGCHFTAF